MDRNILKTLIRNPLLMENAKLNLIESENIYATEKKASSDFVNKNGIQSNREIMRKREEFFIKGDFIPY